MKLIEVVEVRNLTKEGPFVERWLSLVKVLAPVERRPHILQTAEIFRCRVVDLGSDAITLEVTGDRGKVEACLEALKPYGILETAGSGQVDRWRYRAPDSAIKVITGFNGLAI